METKCPVCKTKFEAKPNKEGFLCEDFGGGKGCHEPLPFEVIQIINNQKESE